MRFDEISRVMLLLASILTPKVIKKMQVNLNIGEHAFSSLDIDNYRNLDKYKNILPKHVQINSLNFKIHKIKMIMDPID